MALTMHEQVSIKQPIVKIEIKKNGKTQKFNSSSLSSVRAQINRWNPSLLQNTQRSFHARPTLSFENYPPCPGDQQQVKNVKLGENHDFANFVVTARARTPNDPYNADKHQSFIRGRRRQGTQEQM
jgi:hypothetical protein